jgi:transcriptional regulator with XRE-family HTH domain
MNSPDIVSVLDRQLLLQLGDRLRRLRLAQGLGTVEMAERVGVTRNTLRNVEAGDPGTAIGTYLRVMSVLGVSGEMALLAGDSLTPPPPGSAAARSRREAPVVQVQVSADAGRHRLQDLQSLAFHEEAVRRVKADPLLLDKAKAATQRWLETGDWRKVLGRTRHAQQLRQASPLVTVLPEEVRQAILAQVSRLRKGVVLRGEPQHSGQSSSSADEP